MEGEEYLMRWLCVVFLAALVGCILSIAWLNDDDLWPRESLQGSNNAQPADAPFLPAPKQDPNQPQP